jgi:hypothetical protein
MDRAKFFEAIRPAFGGSLSQDQVDGMSALLDAGAGLPLHHMAHVLANVRRETGGIMAPIKETVQPHHKNKHPTDKEVIRRLNVAWRTGKLPWVKTPYWDDGWFGRGQIQITHKRNYAAFGISNPDDALKPHISAHIAVTGMRDGLFTGRKLADFVFPGAIENPPANNPRRIVNGQDGSDAEVARSHRQFAAALERAGWVAGQPQPAQVNKPSNAEKPAHASIWRQIFAWFTGARQ